MMDPTARPALRLLALLRCLQAGGVDWVLTGSTVLAVHGGRLIPNDVDVTPDLDPANLERLAGVLRGLDAVPAFLPDWPQGPDLAACAGWSPDPATEQNLDHLFVTRVGMVDVPPRLCGTYERLITDATRVDIGGVPVAVCALSEVLDRLQGRIRAKDQARADIYQQLADLPADRVTPDGVAWLLDQLGEPSG